MMITTTDRKKIEYFIEAYGELNDTEDSFIDKKILLDSYRRKKEVGDAQSYRDFKLIEKYTERLPCIHIS